MKDVQRPATTFLLAHSFNSFGISSISHLDNLFDGTYIWYSSPYWNEGSYFYFADDHLEWYKWKGSWASDWAKYHPSPDPGWPYSGGLLIWGP